MEKLFKKGKGIVTYCIAFLLVNSCATILNGKRTVVKLSSDQKSQVVYNNDTIPIHKEKTIIEPLRSKKTIKLSVLQGDLKNDFYLKKRISPLFWTNVFNLNLTYGGGFVVDLTNNKRFTYKRNLHFATDTIHKKIFLSKKKVTFIPKNQVFVYTNPLKLIDFFSIPMGTLGVEYFVKDNISISAEFGLSPRYYSFKNIINIETDLTVKEKGNMYRIEGKWYNSINFTNNSHLNEYISLEFRQINSQFNDVIEYVNKNDVNQNNSQNLEIIRDIFATKKRVSIINFKYGFLVPLGEKFYVDLYSGLGLRIKNLNDFNKEFDPNVHEIYEKDEDGIFSFNLLDLDSSGNFLNISLGVKFGYKF